MDDKRYSFAQIGQALGVDVQTMEKVRRSTGETWHPKGYTLQEILRMTQGMQLPMPEKVAKSRSQAARELYALLEEAKGHA